jgi:hypothetical protein
MNSFPSITWKGRISIKAGDGSFQRVPEPSLRFSLLPTEDWLGRLILRISQCLEFHSFDLIVHLGIVSDTCFIFPQILPDRLVKDDGHWQAGDLPYLGYLMDQTTVDFRLVNPFIPLAIDSFHRINILTYCVNYMRYVQIFLNFPRVT